MFYINNIEIYSLNKMKISKKKKVIFSHTLPQTFFSFKMFLECVY